VMMPLSRRFRVIAPYLIGFGPSDQPHLPYDAATFVDYLGGFLDARAADGATLVGESMGGWVVGHYAVRQGQRSSWGRSLPRISHLVFVDGAVQVHPGDGGGAQDSINSPTVAKLAHDFYVTLPKVDNGFVLKALGPHMLGQQVSDNQLQKITTPTLVIWGREDKILPLKDGRHLAAQIPGARIVIIENSGHLTPVEQPRALLAALDGFLTSHG
jgi:pimeloyl-ACP methyl ester carboxylesterase